MRKALLAAGIALLSAGCIPPQYMDKFNHPHPTTAEYDWRCDMGPIVQNKKTGVSSGGIMYANDKGVHDLTDVLTDNSIVCIWVTPQQVCKGAPADEYNACLVSGE